MKYALLNDKRVEAQKGIKNAICPCCKIPVISKCGTIKKHHWAHKTPCSDSWWEPETPWHREWKEQFPVKQQEVVMFDKKSGEKHIADIRNAKGIVIELQNSSIKPEEVQDRNDFYKNIVWVVNADEKGIMKNCSLKCIHLSLVMNVTYICGDGANSISIELDHIPAFGAFVLNRTKFYKNINHQICKHISKHSFRVYDVTTNEPPVFMITYLNVVQKEFTDKKPVNVKEYCYSNYLSLKKIGKYYIELNEFSVDKVMNVNDCLDFIFSSQKYYLKKAKRNSFNYLLKSDMHTFIDNLQGVPNTHLFWYQKGKLISKARFLEKYLKGK